MTKPAYEWVDGSELKVGDRIDWTAGTDKWEERGSDIILNFNFIHTGNTVCLNDTYTLPATGLKVLRLLK